jgi:3-hydroxyacyl-CoA dehydrogenase
MGGQIAAHVANAGVPVILLDISADMANQGLERVRTLKPDPFFLPDTWKLITTGSLNGDLARIKDVDWVMEAVVEQLDVKRSLLAKVDTARRPGSIVSSNTSGIPIGALAEGRSDDFRRCWLGTHFFNPPRYLRLLEVIPTPDTMPDVVRKVTDFADRRLGKGVVLAQDSPNFIGNHIALYGLMRILAKLASGEYTIEEIDAITGPALGRPKSATFRTMDLAGIDILADVVHNLHERLSGEHDRATFALPGFVAQMVQKGLVGEKSGAGFYKRIRKPTGESDILAIDIGKLEFRPMQRPRFPSIEATRSIEDVGERVKSLFASNDKVGAFLRETLAPTLVYTARVTPRIAHSIDDVDRVMRWGFGWDLGPFELMDAIGVQHVLDAARSADPDLFHEGIPPLIEQVLDGRGPHGAPDRRGRFRNGQVSPGGADLQILRCAKERHSILKKNAGASLVNLGDGVLCVEFHSKMNAIGGDTIQMLQIAVREAEQHFTALIVGNDAPHFSAGANLMLVLLEAQEENWDEIDLMVRAFQQTMMALKYADVPVIVAPGGLTLGGGCEIALHGDRVQAAAETYMGLVEVGVGLIPAGGGTKEMLSRAIEQMPPGITDFLPYVQRAFETIAFARTSTSGHDARRLGYLRSTDAFTMNRERLIADAKALALERVREGYQKCASRSAIPVGGDAVLAPLKLGVHLAWKAGRISDHDALIGRKLATIMAGGALPHPTTVTEQHLLDLEREAFLSLVAERKTQERIQHTLKTGKPLRN